VMKEGKWR